MSARCGDDLPLASGAATQLARRALDVFERSLDVATVERPAWVLAACADDAALLEAVRKLQHADGHVDGFLAGEFSGRSLLAAMGNRIGPYRLDRLIAEGGMGAVYLAHRDDGAYRQDVAIKLIRPLLLDADLIRRFESERQILAQLKHPNIAQMIDGGTTPDGTPFVVMEYIEGMTITDYCTRLHLGLRARLDLFRGVCAAVQAAHRNLIVHRDLKPGNILVTADGIPKLLDFGIAKILQAGDRVEAAQATALALTPEYASPEQFQKLGVTTSSDVYSLGVLLYELLSGVRPYALENLTPMQAERLICREVPDPPSAAVLQRSSSSESRKTGRALRGDLDTITLMALRKEPERRYGSVQELSDDLHRYLRGLPINARRDSMLYRLGRFGSRYRWGLAAACLLLVSMLAGITATSWQARRAQAQAARAETEQAKAENLSAFFENILMSPSTQWLSKIGKGPQVTMAEVLEIASQRADAELASQPETHAEVLDTIGQSLQGMGLYDQARDNAARAVAIADAKLPSTHHLRADAYYHLAQAHHLKGEFAPAEQAYRHAIAVGAEILPARGETLALMHNDLSVLLGTTARFAEAEIEQTEAIRLQRLRMGSEINPPIAIGTGNLGALRMYQGDLEGALSAFDEALGMFATLPGETYVESTFALLNRSILHSIRGKFEEAGRDADKALEIGRERYGEEHPFYALLILRGVESGIALDRMAQLDQQLAAARRIFEQRLDPMHPYQARLRLAAASLHLAKAEYADARDALREALRILEAQALFGAHPDRIHARVLAEMGKAELRLGHHDVARPLLEKSLELEQALFGPDVDESRRVQELLQQAGPSDGAMVPASTRE